MGKKITFPHSQNDNKALSPVLTDLLSDWICSSLLALVNDFISQS